jgi:hypothetical protein
MAKKHKEKRRKWQYKQRREEDVIASSKQTSGGYDSYFKNEFKVWKIKDGDHTIRIMPPTWEADIYRDLGFECYVHYNVGPDNASYLCALKNGVGDCAICDERTNMSRANGHEDEVKELTARKKYIIWMIDRDDEASGPQLWAAPWTFIRDVNDASKGRKSGKTLYIENPDEGYDIEFEKIKKANFANYIRIMVAREPSAVSDDEDIAEKWMDYITDNPVTDVLRYYDYDYILKIHSGTKSKDEDAEEDDDDQPVRSTRRKSFSRDDDDDDDTEDVDDDEEDEEDEDDTPKSKRKKHDFSDDDSRERLREKTVERKKKRQRN